MTVRNATEFVELVENTLGWEPPVTKPRWRALMVEAGKVKRRIAGDPELYSWANLELTVRWLRQQGKPVTPVGVCWFVPDAIAAAPASEVTSALAGRVHQAVVEAMVAGEPDWVERLARATGDARRAVLADWEAHRG